VFDPGISLFSRQVRVERGSVALNAEVKPDIEFVEASQASEPETPQLKTIGLETLPPEIFTA
jgi:hypothetical protein